MRIVALALKLVRVHQSWMDTSMGPSRKVSKIPSKLMVALLRVTSPDYPAYYALLAFACPRWIGNSLRFQRPNTLVSLPSLLAWDFERPHG